MSFSISPVEYIRMLAAIPIHVPGGGAGRIAIRNYRCEMENNGGAVAGLQFASAVSSSARRMHLDLASNTVESDPAIAAINRHRQVVAQRAHHPDHWTPMPQTNTLDLRRAVTGKATIHQIRSVLVNLGIWLANDGPAHLGRVNWNLQNSYWGPHEGRRIKGADFVQAISGSGGLTQKLQLIADTFFGFDCNGFVGSWLHLNGQRNRNSESAIPDLFTEAQAIGSTAEIHPYQLIRFGGDIHVNIIESPGGSTGEWFVCGSEAGGIGRFPYTIHEVRGQAKRFHVARVDHQMSSDSALIGPAEPSPRRARA